MVLRANDPSLSAISSYPGPKILRKSFVKNLPRFFAADAVIVFTGAPPTYRAVVSNVISFVRRFKPVGEDEFWDARLRDAASSTRT
jgi:hypothetical protein